MKKRRSKKRLPTNYFITYENDAPAGSSEVAPTAEREVSAAEVLRPKKKRRR